MLYLVNLGYDDYEVISANNFHEFLEEMEKRFNCVPPYEYPIYEVKELGVLSFDVVKVFKPCLESE